jgi:hypothetical protein
VSRSLTPELVWEAAYGLSPTRVKFAHRKPKISIPLPSDTDQLLPVIVVSSCIDLPDSLPQSLVPPAASKLRASSMR